MSSTAQVINPTPAPLKGGGTLARLEAAVSEKLHQHHNLWERLFPDESARITKRLAGTIAKSLSEEWTQTHQIKSNAALAAIKEQANLKISEGKCLARASLGTLFAQGRIDLEASLDDALEQFCTVLERKAKLLESSGSLILQERRQAILDSAIEQFLSLLDQVRADYEAIYAEKIR